MTTGPLTVADLASRALAQVEADGEAWGDAMFKESRARFLVDADDRAGRVLGDEAAARLQWQYTGAERLPANTEQATASLGEDRGEYLRYRYTTGDEMASFALVQPCGTCGRDQVDEVRDLVHLGYLLETAADLANAAQGGDGR
ncbi:DUF6195 family protein [Streptomyces sp. NPDC059788]|uniref:DUF6195 family protein n=1 Tax=Streptomyces sp. NPDC059788 TaxID=3346948 RepID=UPI00365225CD